MSASPRRTPAAAGLVWLVAALLATGARFGLALPTPADTPRGGLGPVVYRVFPDPGTLVAPALAKLDLEFSEPIETGFVGNVTVWAVGSSPALAVWATAVVSPFVWVLGASVTVDLPSGLLHAGNRYQVSVDAGGFFASKGGALFAGIAASDACEWCFDVNEKGPVFHNSTVPATLSPQLAPLVAAVNGDLRGSNMRDTMVKLSSYYNRFFASDTGVAAAKWVEQQYVTVAQAAGRLGKDDISVTPFEHAWKMPSLVVRIRGGGGGSGDVANANVNANSSADEVVVLGAHLDSINRQNWTINVQTGRAPGANDDGSAVAFQLEFFRVLLARGLRLRRTLELHVYSGEEEGLYGSADVAADYARRNVNVVAMLQLDQMGFLRNPSHEVIGLFTDNTDAELRALMKLVVGAYATIPYEESNENHRADSDFHSWTNNGYRAMYIAEGPVDDIVYGNAKHSPHDVIDGVSISHVLKVGAAAVGFVLEVVGPAARSN